MWAKRNKTKQFDVVELFISMMLKRQFGSFQTFRNAIQLLALL